jgi:hypothetical protein
MITNIDSLLYQAEEKYLGQQDLAMFKSQIFSLEKRLRTYEILRAKETDIFQYVANHLANNFPNEPESKIERALKHWLTITRYCGMAMLSDNPTYLTQRVLEWLPEQIEAHKLKDLERSLASSLQKRLQKIFTPEQFSLLQPYLEQAQNALLK